MKIDVWVACFFLRAICCFNNWLVQNPRQNLLMCSSFGKCTIDHCTALIPPGKPPHRSALNIPIFNRKFTSSFRVHFQASYLGLLEGMLHFFYNQLHGEADEKVPRCFSLQKSVFFGATPSTGRACTSLG